MLENQNVGANLGLNGGIDALTFSALPDVFGIVKAKLQQAASNSDLFSQVFGDKANTAEILAVRSQWAIGDFSQLTSLQILSAADMNGAYGAYASSSKNIYLSDALFQDSAAPVDSIFGAVGVLVEETFHWLDDRVGTDTQGDEGELARNLVFETNVSSAELNRIRSDDDRGFITVDGQSLSVEKNDTLGTATDLGTLNTVTTYRSGWVGTYREWWGNNSVPNDYYRFRLNSSAKIDLKLMNLENDVDLYLLNANGTTIQSSTNSGRSEDSISTQLGAGNYYIHVKQYSGNSRYDLGITSILIPFDYAGNDRGAARNIGTLGTNNSGFFDWVGGQDRNDYYSFYLNGTRDLRLSLTGLWADADVEVLNSSGAVIGSSKSSGNNSESISLNNLGAGTYYARVYQFSGDTYYTLNLRAEDRIQQFIPIVRQLYLDVLNREPDAGGSQYWTGQMASGMTLAQLRSAFANGQESRNNINAAYRNVLLRDADASGLQGYVNALANNSTLRQVYESIATSNEARSNFWTAQYYNNTNRNGSVVFAQSFGRTNTGFDSNWQGGSPSGWVSNDNFSARVFGRVTFGAGLQEIRVGADDGVMVRIGGQTVINRLVDQPFTVNTAVFNSGNGGTFDVEIEYYERGGDARLNFSTIPIAPPDNAGNSKGAARYVSLGTSTTSTFQDWVGSTDTNDFYSFYFNGTRNLRLNLTGLSADADVEVLNSSGAVIGSSRQSGTSSETININNLGAGTYYARVNAFNGATYYNLSLRGEVPDWFQTSVGFTSGGTERHVTFQRVNSPGFIENKPTWLVIHGWNGEAGGFRDLAGAIEEYDGHWGGGDEQVLTVDWDAARTGMAGTVGALAAASSWIDTVAESIKNTILSWGISASNINLVGHSLGAYVAYEVSERIGGRINKLVALNPATTTAGGYDLNQVNFSRYSTWSWAFWHNNATDSGNAALTAHESFVLDLQGANPDEGHGGAKILWTNMLKDKNGSMGQYFGLEDITRSAYKPWGQRQGWEARIKARDTKSIWWGDTNWVAYDWVDPGYVNIG